MNIKDGTEKGIKLTYGDYVRFGDGTIYQVRGNGKMPQLHLMTCEDCGKTASYFLFGVGFCPDHEPKPTSLKKSDRFASTKTDNEYYQTYMQRMKQLRQARESGLESVKARVLAELRGEK